MVIPASGPSSGTGRMAVRGTSLEPPVPISIDGYGGSEWRGSG
jgi:hypothetical protein